VPAGAAQAQKTNTQSTVNPDAMHKTDALHTTDTILLELGCCCMVQHNPAQT
jgi:hypothetical protein